jgi:hypothetical protein
VIHYSHFATQGAARRPLLIATGSLILIAGMLGDPQAGASTTAAAGIATSEQRSISAPIVGFGRRPAVTPHLGLALFNRDRAAAGLPLLSESRMLDVIAVTRAQQMTVDGLTHVRPGSAVMAVTELLKADGVTYSWNGENIFWAGGPPFDDAVAAAEAWWMNSPEHRDNILGPHFRQVGIGTVIDGGKMYISTVFTD